MTKKVRILAAMFLALGLAGIASPRLALAATVSGCPTTEAALSTDITSAGPGGTVAFTCSSPTTINFTSAITISQSVTLDGSGSQPVAFDGGHSTQLFIVGAGTTLGLSHVALKNGNSAVFGGAIANFGTLTITASTLTGNFATEWGGAIGSVGTVSVSASTLSGNTAGSGGGAVWTNGGSLTITTSGSCCK